MAGRAPGKKVSALGLAFGLCFFAASLTPSLIPKSALLFGLLGGLGMTTGYFLAVVLTGLWRYMELPEIDSDLGRKLTGFVLTLLGLSAIVWGLAIHRPGQNSIRVLMGMEPLALSHEVIVVALSAAIFAMFLLLGRTLAYATRGIDRRLAGIVPPRVALTLSIILVATLSWHLSNGLLLRWGLNTMDDLLAEVDARIDPDLPTPSSALRSGGPESLIGWDTMGAQGRNFVAGGWQTDAISDFLGRKDVREPIRIYAGLNSAETAEARARLVLDEMIRTGAFGRSVVIVATPTGTGWIDEAAVDPLEVLFGGDIAIAGMQYSYLMSPLALFVEPDVAPESARALIRVVRDHWTSLPEDARPRLYLHGLSLGSYGSEQALSLVDWIDEPLSGALWSGPTYANPLWKQLTEARNPDSPVWAPRIDDGRTVRFTTQNSTVADPEAEWPRTRILFLQYPSDPITFFELAAAFRPPAWMTEDRAPDVSGLVRWYPIVTMLQLAIDMAAGTDVPAGFGHLFAAEHYIDAWVVLTEPEGISADDIQRLKAAFP